MAENPNELQIKSSKLKKMARKERGPGGYCDNLIKKKSPCLKQRKT
jgi:hypothetical protein